MYLVLHFGCEVVDIKRSATLPDLCEMEKEHLPGLNTYVSLLTGKSMNWTWEEVKSLTLGELIYLEEQ